MATTSELDAAEKALDRHSADALCCLEVKCDAANTPRGAGSTVPLIFVPGFSGSELVRGNEDVVYLTAFQALGVGSVPDLSLPLTWTGDASQPANTTAWHQGRDGAVATGVIDEVVAASCIRVQVYGPFSKWLQSCLGRPSYTYAYDWRRSPLEIADALLAYIKSVSAAHGGGPVQLIGHSFGGVQSLVAVHRLMEEAAQSGGPLLVHSAVFVGAPFQGSWGTLAPFSRGFTVGISNKQSLSAERFVSISGYYTFLPLLAADVADTDAHLVEAGSSGRSVALNLTDADTWLQHQLAAGLVDATSPAYTFITHATAQAALFRQWLRPPPSGSSPSAYPPLAVVAGKAHATACNYTISTTGIVDFANPASYVEGDGSVRYTASTPPPGVPLLQPVVLSNKEHSDLMQDLPAIKTALDMFNY